MMSSSMMSGLPTRVRQNIRDQVTSPSSTFHIKSTALQTSLGYPISLDPEWSMLWKTLQPFHPDQATFVPHVSEVLVMWCEAFSRWLEAEEHQDMVEKLLDGLAGRRVVEIIIEVSPNSGRPTTAWKSDRCLFVIALPKAAPVQKGVILAGFSSDLLSLFTASPSLPPTSITDQTKVNAGADDPESWADLGSPDSPEMHAIRTPSSRFSSNVPKDLEAETFPEVSTILRPEELLKKPPYWLVVRQEGFAKVSVQGSHAQTLSALEAYLKRWCRGEVGLVNRPPMVEIRLQQSAFGLGLLNDTLTMEAIRGREVSAMVVLVFVESVLGYATVDRAGTAGCVWEFKRDRAFK